MNVIEFANKSIYFQKSKVVARFFYAIFTLMETQAVNKLGGMALVQADKDFYSCPEWINEVKWKEYRKRYLNASKGNPDLLQIDLELTDACNLRCIECPISSTLKRKINKVDVTKAKKILQFYSSKGVAALKLNYINEPLLNFEDLIEIAKFAKEIGILDIYFTTNGTLLNQEKAIKLIDSELISRIQVSIDATNKETYDQIRIGGNYQTVLGNIDFFMKYRKSQNKTFPMLRVNFLSLPENKGQEKGFLKFWKDKVDAVAIQRSVLKPDSQRELGADEYKLNERFCPNPFRQLVIRADMSVLPCCSFWGCNIKLGDLNLDSNNTFFDEKLMKNLRNSFTDTGKNLFAACKSCLSSCDPTD